MNRSRNSVWDLITGFDPRILLVFIILLALGMLSFISKFIGSVDCENTTFYIVAKNRLVGETIEFYNETPNASSWEWNFGDNSKNQFDKNVTHHYKTPGRYRITLTINDNCVTYKDIVIKSVGELSERSRKPEILAPRVVKVGEEVVFDYYYSGNDIFSWEWSFGETSRLDDTESNPVYVYKTPGIKKVSLIVNGNVSKITSQTILVKPKDPVVSDALVEDVEIKPLKLRPGPAQIDPAEEYAMTLPVVPPSSKKKSGKSDKNKKNAPKISEEQFELLLHQVAKQSKTKDDFGTFLCDDYKIPVLINDSKIMPFDEFCKKITGKTLKISNIRLSTNDENCIINVEITYKIKKHLLWIND
jgi:PKD repeat protein